ncbi:hypothetical protein [Methylobacterium sp. Leaf466]|uniref:hypothetical protein n=1 Tax=Methylobacterium sp. Leaf466 TaxID=1736386 RepID=UPI0006F44F50|nr:hypothetical protein [Methylobacterium sp. Leaf466]KQT86445.1 hypothetical protein ASG59_17490 [Methylobacterium sp. Leaf466]
MSASAPACAGASPRVVPDIEKLPGEALITRQQLAAVSSFALITLKVWAKQGRGPRITVVEGRPRYRVRDVREWMGAV